MKKNKAMREITMAAAVAAIYIALTYLSAALGIASGVIQFRLSEMLCVLPMFIRSAVPGLYVGCLLSNLLTGGAAWDVIFGSFATFIGAAGTYFLRSKNKIAAVFCPVVSNVLIVPFVLRAVYGAQEALPFLMLTVGIGEVVTCVILGLWLYSILSKRKGALGKYFD